LKSEEIRKTVIPCARELNLSRKESASVLNVSANEARHARHLWGNPTSTEEKHSKLVKLGLAVIAFPDPGIGEAIGGMLIVAGLVQEKIKRSSIRVADAYNTFQDVTKEIQKIRRELI
jgi:hypothetical protein